LVKYFGSGKESLIDLSFNDKLLVEHFIDAKNLKNIINSTIDLNNSSDLSSIPWYSWVTGTSNVKRLTTRVSHDLSDAIYMIAFWCPKSTPIVYYGDELGIEDSSDTSAARFVADDYFKEVSVMQWTSNSSTAGFSGNTSVKPWLKVHQSYKEYNVDEELKINNFSHIKVFKTLVEFRKKFSDIVFFGETKFPFVNISDVFIMARIGNNFNGFLLAINFNYKSAVNVTLNETYLPESGYIRLINSQYAKSTSTYMNQVNHKINLTNFYIHSLQSILIEFDSEK